MYKHRIRNRSHIWEAGWKGCSLSFEKVTRLPSFQACPLNYLQWGFTPTTRNGLSSTILRQSFWRSSSPYLPFPQKKEKLKESLTGPSTGTTSAHQAAATYIQNEPRKLKKAPSRGDITCNYWDLWLWVDATHFCHLNHSNWGSKPGSRYLEAYTSFTRLEVNFSNPSFP